MTPKLQLPAYKGPRIMEIRMSSVRPYKTHATYHAHATNHRGLMVMKRYVYRNTTTMVRARPPSKKCKFGVSETETTKAGYGKCTRKQKSNLFWDKLYKKTSKRKKITKKKKKTRKSKSSTKSLKDTFRLPYT